MRMLHDSTRRAVFRYTQNGNSGFIYQHLPYIQATMTTSVRQTRMIGSPALYQSKTFSKYMPPYI